jgi:hypothetical protein
MIRAFFLLATVALAHALGRDCHHRTVQQHKSSGDQCLSAPPAATHRVQWLHGIS